MTAASLYMFSK